MKLRTNFFVQIALVCFLLYCSQNFRTSAYNPESRLSENKISRNVLKFDWSCNSNETCTAEHSFCNSQKKCDCPSDFVFDDSLTSCVKVATAYGQKCEKTVQCSAYLQAGGICNQGACNCIEGYHYLHGRCHKSSGLGEKCNNDDDCYTNTDYEALSCKTGICQCRDNFYQREYRTCRREAKEIGASCMIDLDCTFDKNARCDAQTGCYLEGNENTTFAKDKVAKDDDPRVFSVRDIGKDTVIRATCKDDKDCLSLGPAICTGTSQCICKPGYSFDSALKNCIPDLGEKCQVNEKPTISKSVCRDGHWGCEGARIPSLDNRQCLKVTRSYNESCRFDEQCYIFGPDAHCTLNKCVCNEDSHYIETEMFCWVNKGINDSCTRDEDCHVQGFGSKLICNKASKCNCPVGTHTNWAVTACISDVPVFGGPCTDIKDCEPLKDSQCLNGICACADNYFRSSGVCVSGINAPCSKNATTCPPLNSKCDLEKCVCKEGFVSPSADRCIPAAPFEGECQYDIQCSSTVMDAICFVPEVVEPDESTIGSRSSSSNGTCGCETNHHLRYDKCYLSKVLGEACDSQGECYVSSNPNSVQCRKGICICDFDTTRINATFCKDGASSNPVFSIWLILSIFLIVDLTL